MELWYRIWSNTIPTAVGTRKNEPDRTTVWNVSDKQLSDAEQSTDGSNAGSER